MLSRQGNYQDAVTYYENALKIFNFGASKSQISKGLKRISTRGKLKFIGMPLKMIVLPSKLAEIWVEKGKTHQKLQQYNEALECYNTALEIYSDSEDAINARYEVLKLMEK